MTKLASSALASAIPTRGLDAVEFICPRCSGKRWGTYTRLCNSSYPSGSIEPLGICRTPRCSFTWPRDLDWLWFHRKVDGAPFTSPESLEIVIGVTGLVS